MGWENLNVGKPKCISSPWGSKCFRLNCWMKANFTFPNSIGIGSTTKNAIVKNASRIHGRKARVGNENLPIIRTITKSPITKVESQGQSTTVSPKHSRPTFRGWTCTKRFWRSHSFR
jgi:hypothetical protein